MKNNPTWVEVFGIKTLIFLALSLVVVNAISAQSVVGKWKLASASETVTDKATGQKQDISDQVKEVVKMTEQILEFHADNTYFTSNKMVGSKTGFEGTGTYSISG